MRKSVLDLIIKSRLIMNLKFLVVAVAGLLMGLLPVSAQKKMDNVFYVQNTMGGFRNAPQTAQQKAEILKTIGFNGLEGFGYDGFFELKKALDQEGIAMPVNYVELKFEADGMLETKSASEIKEMIKASAKGAVIYFHLHSDKYKTDREAGDQVVAKILRELADYSVPFGIKLCAYPHADLYCETVEHSVKLAKMVDRKNYGAAMNLCHLLKVEGSTSIEQKIREFAPYLFAVNICGADDGDTKVLGWDKLIQPLGEGTFDTYLFVKTLIDNGYRGPFGLQCYNLKGDAKETLTRSMKVWKGYQKRYVREK
jgi:sugar phosphate isomerase/epimerase